MKKSIIVFTLLCCSVFVFGQKHKEVNLIQVDSTWGKEIIQMPFWFAPTVNYEGYEDIRFAKGWEETDSSGFWVLVFAWDINLNTKPTTKFFEENLKHYFDGLMKVVNEDESLIIQKTKAFFLENKNTKGMTTFTGTVETYDAFTTRKTIRLNVIIEIFYCKSTKKYIPLFKLAPKEFNDKVWNKLKKIKLHAHVCNHNYN